VLFSAVIGVPDEIYQEAGWAFVTPAPGKEVTPEALQELCRSKIANFRIPKKFIIRPRTEIDPDSIADGEASRS